MLWLVLDKLHCFTKKTFFYILKKVLSQKFINLIILIFKKLIVRWLAHLINMFKFASKISKQKFRNKTFWSQKLISRKIRGKQK